MIRFDSACNVCGSRQFRTLAERSDGIPIITCTICGHGVVQYFPHDLQTLYGNEYFSSHQDSGYGYSDYHYTAEHGVAWAAALISLLQPRGRALDIGCADGHLLKKLPDGYERFGIEPNATATEQCRAAGITVIASDVLDEGLRQNYAASFDIASAIAVFEHIPDFKSAIEASITLLRPEGLLLFEVPILTEDVASDPWLRTSLEHIHYPTEQSLHYLFREVLGLELGGSRVVIKNFACTYIGITSKSREVTQQANAKVNRWMNAPPSALAPDEARFRWLLELIHAANAASDVLGLYRYIHQTDWNMLIVRRISELWSGTLERCADIERYLRQVEQARDWHANQAKQRDEIITLLEAQSRAREAESRAREAASCAQAESRVREAERRTQESESRAREAESRTQESESRAREAESHTQESESRAREAESRAQQVTHNMLALQQSLSWKVTRPLRLLGRLFLRY